MSPMPKQRIVTDTYRKLQSKFVYMLDLGLYTEATGQLHAPATIFTEGGPSVHIAAPRRSVRTAKQVSTNTDFGVKLGIGTHWASESFLALLQLHERAKSSPVKKYNCHDCVGSEESHIVNATVSSRCQLDAF